MKLLQFDAIYTENGWLEPGFVLTDAKNNIVSVTSKAPRNPKIKTRKKMKSWLIPGWQNCHSHVFQFAMAGLAEHVPSNAKDDDFWSWREAMYDIALTIAPQQLEKIAIKAFQAMQKHGVTDVVEFHYLHHDPKGKPYANRAELAERIMSAAKKTGMNLCLTPLLYRTGDFGKPAFEKQRRFISNSVDEYAKLLEKTRTVAQKYSNVRIGVGVHSLRGATKEDIEGVLSLRQADEPFHMHISEQVKEVSDCEAFYGKRPVQWLLENIEVNEHFNLVHATHMNELETRSLAHTKANVVLCPSTEGNLGDGFFPLIKYKEAGGHYALGSDSNISVNLAEDLRWLDYMQRLQNKKRNVLCKPGQDSAQVAWTETFLQGRRSNGVVQKEFFPVGSKLSGVLLDPKHICFEGKPKERRLAAYVYASDPSVHIGIVT